jgi:hypothetical protein
MGGCLFLDEAYALVDGGGDGFSSEAVRTLLTEVENNRTNLLVVLAGYEDKMLTNEDSLMKTDPGLPRRFATTLHLRDYSPAELALIAEKAARERFELRFDDGLLEDLAAHIVRCHSADVARQNGGLAINLTEQAFRRLAKRVVEDGLGMSAAAQVLIAADFAIGEERQQSPAGDGDTGAELAADMHEVNVDRPASLPSFGKQTRPSCPSISYAQLPFHRLLRRCFQPAHLILRSLSGLFVLNLCGYSMFFVLHCRGSPDAAGHLASRYRPGDGANHHRY